MMTVLPFKPEHLERIQARNTPGGDCPKTVMNTAFTFMDGEQVIAIFGGFPFVPGVIHFWGLLSEHVREKPLEFHKLVRKVLRWYEVNEKPRRIQIDVCAEYGMGCRWAESLGFTQEALLRRWGPNGQDHFLYGKVV